MVKFQKFRLSLHRVLTLVLTPVLTPGVSVNQTEFDFGVTPTPNTGVRVELTPNTGVNT